MSSIGSGGPPIKPDGMRPDAATLGQAKESAISEKKQQEVAKKDKKVVDSFQRVAPQLAQLAGKKMGGVQFTNEHLAQVAMAFAGLLRKNPNANRRERARMFAKAFLKSRKFGCNRSSWHLPEAETSN